MLGWSNRHQIMKHQFWIFAIELSWSAHLCTGKNNSLSHPSTNSSNILPTLSSDCCGCLCAMHRWNSLWLRDAENVNSIKPNCLAFIFLWHINCSSSIHEPHGRTIHFSLNLNRQLYIICSWHRKNNLWFMDISAHCHCFALLFIASLGCLRSVKTVAVWDPTETRRDLVPEGRWADWAMQRCSESPRALVNSSDSEIQSPKKQWEEIEVTPFPSWNEKI